MKQVWDPIRQTWVAATPEEIVRQRWLARMVGELGFSKEFLTIEKELETLPHLQNWPSRLPTRRIDILSYSKNLQPLLLIECKEGVLKPEALQQALAYNSFVQAPYVAIVNTQEIRLHFKGTELNRLPSYRELMESL